MATTTVGTAGRVAPDTRTTRWAGLAGLGFAVSVAASNIWGGAVGLDPDADAGAAEIVEKFAEHQDAYGVLFGWTALNLVLLVVFLGGAWTRLRGADPTWARAGCIGVALVAVLFPLTMVPQVALSIGGEQLGRGPNLVNVLWDMHLATFALTSLALGVGLLGLSLAAVAAGLVPAWFRVVGPIGGALLIVGAVPVKAVAEGSSVAMVGLVGFVVWLVFLAVLGTRMWREA
jgi:hypothetical protein